MSASRSTAFRSRPSCAPSSGRRRQICRSAGTSLRNAVRIQQFHTNLGDLPAAIEVWDEAMGHAPLPLSATEVPWLPIPGARVQVDLWVYVPR